MRSFVLDDLCSIVGYSATRTLAVWYSGRYLYVPVSYKDAGPIQALIGERAARSLINQAPGDSLFIPRCWDDTEGMKLERGIAERLSQGMSTQEVAGEIGATVRWVQIIQKRLEEKGLLIFATRITRGTAAKKQVPPRMFLELPELTAQIPMISGPERELQCWVSAVAG